MMDAAPVLRKVFVALLFLMTAHFLPAQTELPPSIRITKYDIDLTLDPAHHSMHARARVTFTALQDMADISFDINPALNVSAVEDETGKALSAARSAETVRITPAALLKRGDSTTWMFTYSGALDKSTGVSLASIGDPVSYLLYAGRWFPLIGYGTVRFTAMMHVHVPAGERVFASGPVGSPHLDKNGLEVFDFNWPHAGFPGTVIAGRFNAPISSGKVHVSLFDAANGGPKINAGKIAANAAREYGALSSQFGPLGLDSLNIVELPEGTVPAYSAPGIVAIADSQLREENSSRLMANTIAHQWWGNQVSPATRNDVWITNGMCRYAELQSIKTNAEPGLFADAVLNVSAGALAYDTASLSKAAQYPDFSPAFEALTYDKGAMIFRMLRWQIGDAAFERTLHGILSEPDTPVSSARVETIAEGAFHQDLRAFFTQWLDSTGAPTLTDNWTLYRLGNNKGYRIVGEIANNMDLFQMPVEVRVQTTAKTTDQRVEMSGAQTQFVVETAEIPRKISLDPDRRLLRSNAEMQVRVHILRGQNLAVKDAAGAIREYQDALTIDNTSSLASYRLGEVYFAQKNYQAAANAFRDALHGDGLPKWTEVWSDLELGEIFDITGQRERAVNQYREAIQTKDDTGGATDLARGYLEHPYAGTVSTGR